MNPKFLESFAKIRDKTTQALRLQKKLEDRRTKIIGKLKGRIELQEFEAALKELGDLYKKGKRILDFCEKGLEYVTILFDESQANINLALSLPERLKSRFSFLRKKVDNLEIIYVFISAFYELRRQIAYIKFNFFKIKRLIYSQYANLQSLKREFEKGNIVQDEGNGAWSIAGSRYFIRMQKAHSKEIELIESIENSSKAKKFIMFFQELNVTLQNLLDKAEYNLDKPLLQKLKIDKLKGLVRSAREYRMPQIIQGTVFPFPGVTLTAAKIGSMATPIAYEYGGIYLAILFIPFYYAAGFCLEFLPSLVAWGFSAKNAKAFG